MFRRIRGFHSGSGGCSRQRLGTIVGMLLAMLASGALVRDANAQSAPTPPVLTFNDLTSNTGRGFGSSWNRYAWSMATFQGDLYVGTWNAQFNYPKLASDLLSGHLSLTQPTGPALNPLIYIKYMASTGGEVWRMRGSDPGNWTRVLKVARANTGFRKLTEFNGQLYASSENISTGAVIYRTSDGDNWEPLTGGPLANPQNNSVRSMTEYNGRLYVGTENDATGGEVWSFDLKGQWQLIAKLATDPVAAEIYPFNNALYVGTWDFTDHYSLFRIDVAGQNSSPFAITDVTPSTPQLRGLFNIGVMSLTSFQGQVYLGTVNYINGFTLIRTATPENRTSWQVITVDGFHSQVPGVSTADNAYSWSMLEMNGVLYLGTFNEGLRGGIPGAVSALRNGSAQLLQSVDGAHWQLVNANGFGSSFTYGFRTLVAGPNGKLYVGTASNVFVPDFGSSLYQNSRSMAAWKTLSTRVLNGRPGRTQNASTTLGQQLYRLFMSLSMTGGSLNSRGSHPFIGTQIYEVDTGAADSPTHR